MYYRLHPDCKLVQGAKCGAIYDFRTGKVYSVNNSAMNLLITCQENPLEAVLDFKSKNDDNYLNFFDHLTTKGVGSLYYFKPNNTQPPEEISTGNIKLEFLWLELTSRCNNRCQHCYATCGPVVEKQDCVPHGRWLSLIEEAHRAGASAIQFIGGEPLMYPNWQELVLKAKGLGYEFIEIFTNGTLIDDNCIEFFKNNNVNIATTIYSDSNEIHDKVTLNPGSFTKTLTAIKRLISAEVPLRVASIIMRVNESEPQKIMNLCREIGVEATPPDVVRPTGRGDDKDLIPLNYTKQPIKPPFYTDATSFTRAQKYHSCLAGKIAVTATGDVIPCIFSRSKICGNILSQSLKDVLSGQPLQECWQTTKDHVDKCKDCEYRYACDDCRPLAQGSDPEKRWLARSANCSYNPYTGIWEE